MKDRYSVVGKRLRKVDAAHKVTGQTVYTGDISFPRMLHCKILRSIHPHARIRSIDTKSAENLSGVIAIITGKDLPIQYGILPITQDEAPLAIDKVRYVGDPVAAVAAVDEETADRALQHIRVDYEVLAPVMSIEESLQVPADEKIHEDSETNNIQKMISLEFGDVEEGFVNADLIQQDLFFYDGNTHLAMEEHATVAVLGPDGKLTLWISTQTPHYLHRIIAEKLDLPVSQVRVIAPPTGGGFGGKTEPFNHDLIVAKLTLMTGRPVKIVLTREEVFYAHRGRHPVLMQVKTGLKNDGSITAMHFCSILDGGAFGSYGVASTYYTGALQTVTYDIPVYKFDGARVFTNKPPSGPKRGHGTPQPRFALEVHIDKIAERLDKNPLDYRLGLLAEANSTTANHLSITTIGLRDCLLRLDESSEFRERYSKLGSGRGLGLACGAYLSGAGLPLYPNKMPHSAVMIKVDRGGGVTVYSGSTDIGQGSDSVLAYMVAEELGISPDNILIVSSDTALTPIDLGSYASRVTLMAGNATIAAARKLRKQIWGAAANNLQVPEDQIVGRDNRLFSEDDPSLGIDFADAVALAEADGGTLTATGDYTPPGSGGRVTIGPSPAYSYSACVAEVTVDPESAELHVVKVWLAHDIGKAINPLLVEGQIEGCIYMGLGEVLMEEQVFRKGMHKSPSMLDYKSPTILETPEIETILIETLDPKGPYGAKEVGQGPLLPVIPAVANAVYDAIGIRVDETPITADKLFKALENLQRNGEKRVGPRVWPDVSFNSPVQLRSRWRAPVRSEIGTP